MTDLEPKETVVWAYFEDWAMDNDVSLDHEDDWSQWWDCWYDGFTKAAAILLIEKRQQDEKGVDK